jgi:hypothetical protein
MASNNNTAAAKKATNHYNNDTSNQLPQSQNQNRKGERHRFATIEKRV